MRKNNLYLVHIPAMARRTGMNMSNYKTDILQLNSYLIGIVTTSLPTLNVLPENYAEYLEYYGKAQVEAKRWVEKTYNNLTVIPGVIADRTAITQKTLKDAESYLERIILRPEDAFAIMMFQQDLKDAQTVISNMISTSRSLVDELDKYQSESLDIIRDNLKQLTDGMLKGVDVDEQKITELTARIGALERDIKSQTAAIVGGSLLVVTGIVMCSLALFTGWGTAVGIAGAVVCGGIAIAGGSIVGTAARKIVDDKEAIKNSQEKCSLYEQDIAALRIAADTFDKFCTQMDDMKGYLADIIEVWQTVNNELNELQQDVAEASNEFSRQDWEQVQQSLRNASEVCGKITDWMGDLDISDLKATDAEITPGMTEEEVKRALDAGNTMSFEEYIMAV